MLRDGRTTLEIAAGSQLGTRIQPGSASATLPFIHRQQPRSVGQQIAFLPMDEGPHYIIVDEQCPCFPGHFPSHLTLPVASSIPLSPIVRLWRFPRRGSSRGVEPDSRPTTPPSSPSNTLGRKRTVIETAGRVGLLCALLVWWLSPGLYASESQFKKKVQIDDLGWRISSSLSPLKTNGIANSLRYPICAARL